MKQRRDLSSLSWTLSGHTPYLWLFERVNKMPRKSLDTGPLPARVPGSVQAALRDAGVIPDWLIGLNSRQYEWVENRHWIFRTAIPDAWIKGPTVYRLRCMGLDYSGWVFVNGQQAGEFRGTHVPHVFDLSAFMKDRDNALEIVFDVPPRWLGQFGYTSRMTDWKVRFNYTWDWTPRLVQIGIWDRISLEVVDGGEILNFRCAADAGLPEGKGRLELGGTVSVNKEACVRVKLERQGKIIREARYSPDEFASGVVWDDLSVKLWWPNLEGDQPLYTVNCQLLSPGGQKIDGVSRRVGFRNVTWRPCQGAPPEADLWLCSVNGRAVFLQGVNFAPIRSNFADLTQEDYAKRLKLYRELGCNMVRINACGFLEKDWFYDLCDELGIMVWQEFPLTSSGLENWPPEDPRSIEEMSAIAASFIERRRHHASLALWCGGNEQMGDLEGRKTGMGKPCPPDHPMLKRLREVVRDLDPMRRYLHTSPAGPRAGADQADFGKGLHWAVHGPYISTGNEEENAKYWSRDDALFRTELCCQGASPVELTRRYAGRFSTFPPSMDNPFWSHPTVWWFDLDVLSAQHGRQPRDLEEYVGWSQQRQARMLSVAVRACKGRFPRCGGVLLWEGHDTFPIPINTSIVDFDGNPKPAALELAKIWRTPPECGSQPSGQP